MEAQNKEQKFKNFFGAVKAHLREDWLGTKVGWTAEDRALSELLMTTQAGYVICIFSSTCWTYEEVHFAIRIALCGVQFSGIRFCA